MRQANGLLLLGLIAMAFVFTKALPRGIRNNNPLNIRENNRADFDWLGEASIDFDDEFEVFQSPVYGYRAGARIIQSYNRRGITTLGDIISTWAPSNENDTESYIASVEKNTGFNRFTVITQTRLVDLFAAMTLHENGQQPYSRETIQQGINLA